MTPTDFFLLLALAALVALRVRRLAEAIVADEPPQTPRQRRIPEGWTVERPAEQVRSANTPPPHRDVSDARYVDLLDVIVDDDGPRRARR